MTVHSHWCLQAQMLDLLGNVSEAFEYYFAVTMELPQMSIVLFLLDIFRGRWWSTAVVAIIVFKV